MSIATNNIDLTTLPAKSAELRPLEFEVLRACHEATLRNQELVPRLAAFLGVPVNEVFYKSKLDHRLPRRGIMPGTDWTFFFHGQECDLANPDGRRLRVDFGPGGRIDTFTGWGVTLFVITTRPPWPVFQKLQAYLGKIGANGWVSDESRQKFGVVWDSLQSKGLLENADQGLLDFLTRHVSVNAEGLRVVKYPPDTPDHICMDCGVAHRQKLSALGREMLSVAADQ